MARKEKQPVHKVVMTEGKRNIIRGMLEEYGIQEALKGLLGGTIKEMLGQKWKIIWAMGNLSSRTAMTTGMVTKPNGSTAHIAVWRLMYHKTVTPHLN